MKPADVEQWFAEYLEVYAACSRGELEDLSLLLDYYAVPLLLTAEPGALSLTTGPDVLEAVAGQVEGLRTAGYDRTETLAAETEVLNATTALHRASFARLRADGSEIARLRCTYVIADFAEGRRIAALLVETPQD